VSGWRNLPLARSFIGSRLKMIGAKAGVNVYAHRLRHTCATQLLNAGCRITSIQALLGHKKLDTTMIYARVHDKTVEQDYFRAVEKLPVL
jgi:site-specific recombinase XerD